MPKTTTQINYDVIGVDELLENMRDLIKRNKLVEAEKIAEYLEKNYPEMSVLYLYKAQIFARQKQKPEEILELSKKAYELNSQDIQSIISLCSSYNLCGKEQEAIELIQKSNFIGDDNLTIRKLLLYGYIKTANYKNAYQELNRIVKLQPNIENYYYYLILLLSSYPRLKIIIPTIHVLLFIIAVVINSKFLLIIQFIPIILWYFSGIFIINNREYRKGVVFLLFASLLTYLLFQLIVNI